MIVTDLIIHVAGIIAAICFILGLKKLSHPATARQGNQLAIVGMVIAVATALLDRKIVANPGSYTLILVAFVIPCIFAWWLSKTVAMTSMPQMVAFFNGMGGGAASIVSAVSFIHLIAGRAADETPLTILLGTVIGAITLTGSIVAWGKLQGYKWSLRVPGLNVANALLCGLVLLGGVYVGIEAANHAAAAAQMVSGGMTPDQATAQLGPLLQEEFFGLMALAGLIGILMVLPIGGADMPVVISLLNSFTGLACAFTGFAVPSYVLVIGGALVGASGTLLTLLMCKAMNRSLANVLFSGFGTSTDSGAAAAGPKGNVKEISVEDLAPMLAYAQEVIIVPGYGMAVAQAQQPVRELTELLEKKGVEVKFAIHPVAGRMPGHMNVLLAEANIPYSSLFDMEDINSDFEKADVALVIGANDVTNPDARSNKSSPIFGMPILDVDHAKNVIVMKRSMSPGFAGVDNPLYLMDNTRMLFGDAKSTLSKLVGEVKQQ
ncbi:MAG: NAD(P)(+) transhydrogenase (Re/Si-specific) subunit beta [Candidatus Xenobia bacterium]